MLPPPTRPNSAALFASHGRAVRTFELLKELPKAGQLSKLSEICDTIEGQSERIAFENFVWELLRAHNDGRELGRSDAQLEKTMSEKITKIAGWTILAALIIAAIGLVMLIVEPFGKFEFDAWGFKLGTNHVGLGALGLSVLLIIRVATVAIENMQK